MYPLGHCHHVPVLAGLTGKIVKRIDSFRVHECIGEMYEEL